MSGGWRNFLQQSRYQKCNIHWGQMYFHHTVLLERDWFPAITWFNCRLQDITLPETNIALKMDGWNTTFLLGRPIFRGELLVSGRVLMISIRDIELKLLISPSCRKPPKLWWNQSIGIVEFDWMDGKKQRKKDRWPPLKKNEAYVCFLHTKYMCHVIVLFWEILGYQKCHEVFMAKDLFKEKTFIH